MSLTWPWALLVVAVVPALLALRWWTARRRKRGAVRVASVALVRGALPRSSRWRRVTPPLLLALALVALGVAAARPQRQVAVSSNSSTIMLTLDVSSSMCSTDVDPNRIEAAEKAAAAFVEAQPDGSQIGLTAFAGAATVLVSPTDDQDKLLKAIGSLVTSRGTAIGQGILTSLDAISEVDPSVAPTGADLSDAPATEPAADVIVLLTDGSNSAGVDPATASQQSADRGVRVYTIGFGTDTPSQAVCSSSQVGSGGGLGAFGGGGGGGQQVIDEDTLRAVADTTGGTYYRAESADELSDALADLPQHVTTATQRVDEAAWFAGLGGVLAAAAVALSLWFNRGRRGVTRVADFQRGDGTETVDQGHGRPA